jgi:cutinase
MGARAGVRLLGVAVLMTWVLLGAPVEVPLASAGPCADGEVVFARGSGEPDGLGGVGQAFVDAIRSHVASLEVYPVDYPASHDYRNSALAGVDDATAHVESVVATCPQTKIVLGGYSQGASVIEMSTDVLSPEVADHVAAVALFGAPASTYASTLMGDPLPTLAPAYRANSIDLCVPGDIVCSEGGNMAAHLMYVQSGMAEEAAAFAASRL